MAESIWETVVLAVFTTAHFLWLRQIRYREGSFERVEKVRAILIAIAFFISVFVTLIQRIFIASFICLAGFIISVFIIILVYYEQLMDIAEWHEWI